MKKTILTAALCCFALAGFAQGCCSKGYEVKAENAYTHYNVRWATGPEDAKHYTTDRLRKEYLIEKVFAPGEVNWTYTMFDRFLIGGAEPTSTPLKLTSIAPLYVDETPGLPIMEFRSKVKALVKQKGVRLIIVDYLQLMQGPSDTKGMREQEVAAISRMLKGTAKELNVAIIALSQLSRNSVQRQGSGGKPILSDLRESGSIEQDADMVIFIHRPDFLGLSENAQDKEKTQIIIAKHRNGETKDIDMLYKGERLKFVEVSDSLYQDMPEYESSMNSSTYDMEPDSTPW